jgi:hypothetical protein
MRIARCSGRFPNPIPRQGATSPYDEQYTGNYEKKIDVHVGCFVYLNVRTQKKARAMIHGNISRDGIDDYAL